MTFQRRDNVPLVLCGSGRRLHAYGLAMKSVDLSPRCLGKTAGGPVIRLVGVNPVADAAPPLVDYGAIRVTALGEETLKGVTCRKFRMSGKDFSLVAWFSRADRPVVRTQSARPDSHSHDWTSLRMDPFACQSFRDGRSAPRM